MHPTLLLATLAALTLPLAAQRTIVVDAAGGPGHHYRALSAGVTAARDGDTILVRAGNYKWIGTSLSKGITVQGAGRTSTNIKGTIAVANLPARSSFTLKDVGGLASTQVLNCRGSVLLDSVSQPSVFLARASARVSLRNCYLFSARFENSVVQVDTCAFPGQGFQLRKEATLEVIGGRLELTNSLVTGSRYIIVHPNLSGSTPAIRATGAQLRLRGKFAKLQVTKPSAPKAFTAVLVGDPTASLVIDPAVLLVQPNTGGAQISGFGRGISRRALPTLHAPGTPRLGQLWSYHLDARPGDVFAIAMSLPAGPTPFLGDLLFLQPQHLFLLNLGRIPTSGSASFRIRHGNLPEFRGQVFALQAAAGAVAQLSNPVPISVR